MVTFNISYISHIFTLPGLKSWSFPCMSVILKLTRLIFIPVVNVKQDFLQAGALGLACYLWWDNSGAVFGSGILFTACGGGTLSQWQLYTFWWHFLWDCPVHCPLPTRCQLYSPIHDSPRHCQCHLAVGVGGETFSLIENQSSRRISWIFHLKFHWIDSSIVKILKQGFQRPWKRSTGFHSCWIAV